MMQAVFTIETIEELAIISVPIRRDILFACQKEALSPKKYSIRAKLSAQNVNYHFGKLYKAGLLYKKYEEKKRGAFETFYQSIAPVIRVDQSIFNVIESNFAKGFVELDKKIEAHIESLNKDFS